MRFAVRAGTCLSDWPRRSSGCRACRARPGDSKRKSQGRVPVEGIYKTQTYTETLDDGESAHVRRHAAQGRSCQLGSAEVTDRDDGCEEQRVFQKVSQEDGDSEPDEDGEFL